MQAYDRTLAPTHIHTEGTNLLASHLYGTSELTKVVWTFQLRYFGFKSLNKVRAIGVQEEVLYLWCWERAVAKVRTQVFIVRV